MNVADMWACLQDHATDNHWRHVAGWRKVCELAGQHLGRLRTYRESLAHAWPPETNAASRAYLAELDGLIDQVQRTHDAAASNQTALSAATQALSTSRTEIKKIYDEYAGKQQLKQAWEETAADPKAAAASRANQPPVTDSDLERLNVRARNIMYGLSAELQQAQIQLRQPPPARPRGKQSSDPDVYGGGASPPIIPPIVPVALRPPVRYSRKQMLSPTSPVPSSKTPQIGPVLGGSGAAPGPALSNSMPQATTSTAPISPSHGVGTPPALIPGSASLPDTLPRGHIRPNHVGRPAIGGAPAGPHSGSLNPPRSVSPPGGIIGGVPGIGHGQVGGGNTPSRRVNPISGVIGGGAAGTAPTGAAGSRPGSGRMSSGGPYLPPFGGSPGFGTPPMAGSGGLQNQRNQDGDKSRRWDPDYPWETDQGVAPIVRPPDEDGPVDPGPAIGLGR
nr:hypothetical protein [Micromonospora tarapacensis]